MRGCFILNPGTPKEIRIPNIITDEGEDTFLKMILRASVAEVSAGGDFFMGLCDQVPAEVDQLSDITTEPTSQGGYARQAISRDATGWPLIDAIGEAMRGQSLTVQFAASGADFSDSIQRAFLCNVVSGSSGLLLAYSGLFPNPILIADGETKNMKYEFYLR